MRKWVFLMLGVGVLLLPVGLAALAQGGYELFWWTVDGGGGTFSGGGYELGGTIGQPDAGEMDGGWRYVSRLRAPRAASGSVEHKE